MLNGQKVVVVLPAYRAEQTLLRTYNDIPHDIVDEVILVDDASSDATVELARTLNMHVFVHHQNLGYGANQKTCYHEALRLGADVVVMLHPDYQYDPRLVTAMAAMVSSGIYDAVVGSRILGNTARRGGMPFYKYIANRLLTATQNFCLGSKLSEFHSGYRAFSRRVLEQLPLLANSDDFVFDNQMLAQCMAQGFSLGEISVPTKYFPEASSINFRRSVVYGLGVLQTTLRYVLHRRGLSTHPIFDVRPEMQFGAVNVADSSSRASRVIESRYRMAASARRAIAGAV
jgi:glycosyltransferase involved in cell wall biosynthesis